MRYIKYFTAILGFFLLGHSFFGAILGFLVGGFISFKLSGGLIGQLSGFGNVAGRGLNNQRQTVFFKTVFTLMGTLAKSDGRVSEQEISHIEDFMSQLNMSPAHRKQAIGYFKTGAQADFQIKATIDEFNEITESSPNLKQMLMVYLVRVALADGQLHPKEAEVMRHIALQLGYSSQAFEQLLAMLMGQGQFAGGHYQGAGYGGGQYQSGGNSSANNPYTAANELDTAYQALGVSKDDSNAQIKKVYRRLIREYHPDKLTGQGLPEAMIEEATERTQEIQTAYDLIKKHRGMR